ncbi:MAG: carbonic anhydrase [Actinomycetota bacterium]
MDRPSTPTEAFRALEEGNARFVHGRPEHPDQDSARRAELAAGQRPFALIFGCSDSRVAAEIVFDQGLGDLFVVRTAGHVVDSGVLGSVEFGVAVLGIPLVVVLGHDSCGAVATTVDAMEHGSLPGGYIRDVVERVIPSVLTGRRTGATGIDDLVTEHVRHTARLLAERSVVLSDAIEAGTCAVVGLTYRLADGRARLVDGVGQLST